MITITAATDADLATVRRIAHETWPATFGNILSPDQIAYMLDMMYSPAALHEQVHQRGHVFLLAHDGDAHDGAPPVGYVSYELQYGGEAVCKIHKIYILPNQQGKGVGRALLDAVTNVARPAGNATLRLNVNRHNRAVQFYERLGFRVVGQETINIGSGFLMEDFVMEKAV